MIDAVCHMWPLARLDSGVPARDALEIRLPSGWRKLPRLPRQTLLHRIGDASAASAKSGTLQSDVDILGKRDRRYGPPPRKRSDDDYCSIICKYVE